MTDIVDLKPTEFRRLPAGVDHTRRALAFLALATKYRTLGQSDVAARAENMAVERLENAFRAANPGWGAMHG